MRIHRGRETRYDTTLHVRISKEMLKRAKRLKINLSEHARERWAQLIEFREEQERKEKEKATQQETK